jgi:RNA polymerase sporulation-specific sigma factor
MVNIANEILMYFRNQKKSAQDVYISDPIDTDKDGNQLTLIDIVSVDDTIFEDVDLKMKAERLHKYIKNSLNGRERMIVEMRYGINGYASKTQREVAKILGISRSYVYRTMLL